MEELIKLEKIERLKIAKALKKIGYFPMKITRECEKIFLNVDLVSHSGEVDYDKHIKEMEKELQLR